MNFPGFNGNFANDDLAHLMNALAGDPTGGSGWPPTGGFPGDGVHSNGVSPYSNRRLLIKVAKEYEEIALYIDSVDEALDILEEGPHRLLHGNELEKAISSLVYLLSCDVPVIDEHIGSILAIFALIFFDPKIVSEVVVFPITIVINKMMHVLHEVSQVTQTILLSLLGDLAEFQDVAVDQMLLGNNDIVSSMIQILPECMDLETTEYIVRLFERVAMVGDVDLFQERIVIPLLDRYEMMDNVVRKRILVILHVAVEDPDMKSSNLLLKILHKLPTQDIIEAHKVRAFIGLWGALNNFDKFKPHFTKEVMNSVIITLDPFDSFFYCRNLHFLMQLSEEADEIMHDRAALVTRVCETIFSVPPETPEALPKSMDPKKSAIAILLYSLPPTRSHPKVDSPFRIYPGVKIPKFVNRSSFVSPKRRPIEHGLEMCQSMVKVVETFLLDACEGPTFFTSGLCLIGMMSYLSTQYKDEFVNFVRKYEIIGLICRALDEVKLPISVVTMLADSSLELLDFPELVVDMRLENVAGKLKYASKRACSSVYEKAAVNSRYGDRNLLGEANLMNVTNKIIELIEEKSASHTAGSKSVKDVVTSMDSPDYEVDDLLGFPLTELLDAGFLEKLNSTSNLSFFLNRKFMRLLQSVLSRTITFKHVRQKVFPLDNLIGFNLHDQIKLTYDPLPGGNRHMLPLAGYRCTVTVTPSVLKDSCVLNLKKPGLEESLGVPVSQGVFKFYYNGIELPQNTHAWTWLQDAKDKTKCHLHFDVVKPSEDADSNIDSFNASKLNLDKPEDNIFARNAFNKDVFDEKKRYIFDLMKKLFDLNTKLDYRIPEETFHNQKLNTLILSWLDSPVHVYARALPDWIFTVVLEYPFLVPMQTRLSFLRSTSLLCFETGFHLQQVSGINLTALGNPMTLKANVSQHAKPKWFQIERKDVFRSAMELLKRKDIQDPGFNIRFKNEDGTGRGPTNEFYTIACDRFCDPNNGMWSETPNGLVPRFYGRQRPHDVLEKFYLLGKFIAHVLFDKKIIELGVSPIVFDALCGNVDVSLEGLHKYDPDLATSLENMLKATPEQLESANLFFVDPRNNVETIGMGQSVSVDAENVVDYVDAIVQAYIGSGIATQIDALRAGICTRLCKKSINIFSTHEWTMICGVREDDEWTEENMMQHINLDTKAGISEAMRDTFKQDFINVLASFDSLERRKFLIFCTGASKLPRGGFAALDPPLSVLITYTETLSSPYVDTLLPTVMTCMNIMKVPSYSSKEVLEERLKYAIAEGSNIFTLS